MKKVVTVGDRKIGKIVAIVAAVLAVLIVVFSSFVIVPAGNTGVVLTFGKVSENVLQDGIHFLIPFVQKVEIMSNKIQVQQVDAAAVSKDLQSVNSTIAVNFKIGLKDSAEIFKNIGRDYQNIMLLPAIQESMKSTTAKYTAEELISKRAAVGEEIKTTLENKVAEYGIIIEKFNIVNFEFSAEFNSAIEAKQVAEQNLLKTETEQKQALVIAETEKQKKILAAEADAEAIKKMADAQADANEKITKSLTETLIEYQKIQKWDGKLPLATGGDPIIDIRSAQEKAANEEKK